MPKRPHFYLGLLIIISSEVLLFLQIKWVGIFFTPIVWTGYILLVDGIVDKINHESWLTKKPRSFLLMFPLSAGFWWVFEFFNLFIRNWSYEGLPAPWISVIGMNWAFATIGPGMFETHSLLIARVKSRPTNLKPPSNHKLPLLILYFLIIVGAACLISILIAPKQIARYLGIPLWVGFILLLDPINYLQGRSSLISEFQRKEFRNFLCLLAAGLICGLLWEFWNYWATARWVYNVPYLSEPKIFEMPLFGYLGFPALALEYYAFYSLTLNWRRK